MAIVPDDKDWTWVLERPCPECGFDARLLRPVDVAEALRSNAAAWRPLLDHPMAATRPTDDRWSALEYACHVRDVFRLYDRRLGWMLDRDDPNFDNWDQDATALAERYGEQPVEVVVTDLEVAGAVLADHFDRVRAGQWARTGQRSDGASFTIDTFARYLVHDPVHHLWDVEQGYAGLGRP